ncbi:MAG: SDR family oxidoreductase [Solirubrobacterales bacterium]|nr:SDR family oxidoreductase [Solirubrobacterales bacterium]
MSTVAVVTGAARGFGLEIARRLVDRGHEVILTDVLADEVRAAADGLGPRAHARVADAGDAAEHRSVAYAALELGRLAVWVNNAGVAYTAKAWEHPAEHVERTVRVNLLGCMHGSRAAVGAMREGGHILNIASLSAFGPVPGLAVYAATKAGVLSFTTSLQGDLQHAGRPIRVHALCPDAADTRMVRDVAHEEDAALLFSGGGLLSAGEVADAAMELLDGRRIVRTLPAWRGALARTAAPVPTAGLQVLRLLRAVGDRRRPSAR